MKGCLMRRSIVLFFVVALFSVSSLYGAAYKGQRVYAKNCLSCHGGEAFIQSKTKKGWSDALKGKGKHLAELHLKNQKAEASWEYFGSAKYTKKLKHLKDFFNEYAKDGGKVPVFSN